ncbi:MAG: hypothetical protein HGA90_07270, partial [Alphaproteobacteria bacterium]|nr:hypothetical protein [Alphaproteobacteria bacterium]
QPMPGLYAGLKTLFAQPDATLWGPTYVKWEVELLRALGFGLNLDRCAVCGTTENLSHVSPRTGRAVSSLEAAPYREKLLALPEFLRGAGPCLPIDILQGLELTGHFLARHVFAPHQNTRLLPPGALWPLARHRLMDYYRRAGAAEEKTFRATA